MKLIRKDTVELTEQDIREAVISLIEGVADVKVTDVQWYVTGNQLSGAVAKREHTVNYSEEDKV
jgi:hypothetical protein